MLNTYYGILLRRTLHTSAVSLLRQRSPRQVTANPGVGRQMQEFESTGAAQEFADDPEGFGDMESDFMQVHRTHKQHHQQEQQQRDEIRLRMIKHKYFREQQLPNLLTYAEKEQIRLLHARQPDDWTAERLAESFPATVEVVQKILRGKWRPRAAKRIRAHDEAVVRNWEQLRAPGGDAQLPPALREHLKKFAARQATDLDIPLEDWPTRTAPPKPQRQEFLSIINSSREYGAKAQQQQQLASKNSASSKSTSLAAASSAVHGDDAEDETYLLENVLDKRAMRIQELKRYKLTPAELASEENSDTKSAKTAELEQRAAQAFGGNPSGTGIISTSSSSSATLTQLDYAQKFESNEVVISVEDQRRYEITKVKDRIHIPRKVWRKGATFRVEDCYYDDDGEFLYRVPGMTSSSVGK